MAHIATQNPDLQLKLSLPSWEIAMLLRNGRTISEIAKIYHVDAFTIVTKLKSMSNQIASDTLKSLDFLV